MSDQEHARAELLTGDDGPHSEDQVLCLTLERKDRERKRERERERQRERAGIVSYLGEVKQGTGLT